jgi:hypothetical protein
VINKELIMHQPRFEAILAQGDSERYTEWHVVEWTETSTGERTGRIVERFGDCSGGLAREEARLLQESHIRTLRNHSG